MMLFIYHQFPLLLNVSIYIYIFKIYYSPSSVPVYDGKSKKISFTADFFDNLSTKLSIYKGEVPRGSFALVGYTIQIQQHGEQVQYFKKPRWVIILAEPNK